MRLFLITLATALLTIGSVQAAGNSTGAVGAVYVLTQSHDPNLNAVYNPATGIFMVEPRMNKPPCGQTDEWAFPLGTPAGRAVMAVVLAAQMQGKQVSVIGTGPCSAWLDRETPLYIIMLP